MIVLIVTGMLALGGLIIRDQNKLFETQMHSYAKILIYQLSASATESYLTSDTLDMNVLVKHLSKFPEIMGIAFYSDEKQPLSYEGSVPATVLFPKTATEIKTQHWNFNTSDIMILNNQAHKSPKRTQASLLSYIGSINYEDVTIGYVLLTLDQSLFTQARLKTLYTIILTTIVLILLTILFAFVLGKRLSRPIEQLVDASKAISRGNYKIRFNERRNDEFGVLMHSLNIMAEGLLHKETVEQAFSRYVSPKVAHEVLNNLESVNLGGQQIDASVLFVDIIGYTKMSQTMQPDEITAMLNEFFSHIAQAAQIYGGHVDKYIGDCAMLVFGVPKHDEHHPYQAISCALLIQRIIDSLNKQRQSKQQIPINFHIAANSGLMLAGNMGSQQRMEYTVIGDAVNLASRIASCAHNNEVVIPETMLNRLGVKEHFTVIEKECMNLREQETPIALYVVTGCTNTNQVNLTKNVEKLLKHDFNKK